MLTIWVGVHSRNINKDLKQICAVVDIINKHVT